MSVNRRPAGRVSLRGERAWDSPPPAPMQSAFINVDFPFKRATSTLAPELLLSAVSQK